MAYRQAALAALQAGEDCRHWCALHSANLLCLPGALSVTEYGTEALVRLALCCGQSACSYHLTPNNLAAGRLKLHVCGRGKRPKQSVRAAPLPQLLESVRNACSPSRSAASSRLASRRRAAPRGAQRLRCAPCLTASTIHRAEGKPRKSSAAVQASQGAGGGVSPSAGRLDLFPAPQRRRGRTVCPGLVLIAPLPPLALAPVHELLSMLSSLLRTEWLPTVHLL